MNVSIYSDRLVYAAEAYLRRGRVIPVDLVSKLHGHGIDTDYLSSNYDNMQDEEHMSLPEETYNG